MAADDLDQLAAHVRYRLGSRTQYAQAWRVNELTRLVVRHWPHNHFLAIEAAGGKNHAAMNHAMALLRAQVRERWEADHGIGPLWNLLLAGTVASISHVILELWWGDKRWRTRLMAMSRDAA